LLPMALSAKIHFLPGHDAFPSYINDKGGNLIFRILRVRSKIAFGDSVTLLLVLDHEINDSYREEEKEHETK